MSKSMSIFKLTELILTLFLIPFHTFAQVDVSDLKFSNQEVQELVLSKFPYLKTRLPSPLESDQILEFLILNNNYDYAQFKIDSDGRTELITQKIKMIRSIIINGNDEVSSSQIRNGLIGISEKSFYNPQQLTQSLESLKSLYEINGFYQSQISARTQKINNDQIDLILEVQEGPVTKINSIVFVMENSDLHKRLTKEVTDYLNEPLTQKNLRAMDNAIQSYLTENKYYQASPSEPKVDIISQKATVKYTIQRDVKYDIELNGVIAESKKDLLKSMELETFMSSNSDIKPELEVKIKNFYLKKGYARIQVKSEELNTKENQKSIKFDINEGPKVKIEKFDFSGRISKDSKFYVDFIKNNSTDLINEGYYNRDDIDLGVKNLIIALQNQGFLSAKALAIKNTYNKDRDQILVSISFDEGPQTILTDVLVLGNLKLNREAIQELLGLKIGDSLKLNVLENGIDTIKRRYKELGYLEMYIANENQDLVVYSDENTKALVNLKIIEGPQISVNSILIEGNSLTKDSVILKELEFKPGDILTPETLSESVSRLQRLGFFSSVEIKTLEEKTQIGDRTVIVRVSERDPGLFNFGAGITNEQELTLRGYTGISYRNIFGTGRGVSTRIESSYNVAKVKYPEVKTTIGYVEPYLFNTRTKGKINIVQSRTVSDFVARKGTEIEQRSFAIEQDITSHILFIYDIANLEKIKDFKIDASSCTNCSEFDIVSTGPTIEVDYRDHPFNPTAGTFSRLNIEYASPDYLPAALAPTGFTETIKYIKSVASFTHYWNVWPKRTWVWANSLKLGYLENLSNLENGGVPYDKKGLTLGGQSTIRGFESDEAFPNARDFDTDSYLLKTNAQMTLYKTELRFPIPWWSNLAGAVFYDGGFVRIKDFSYDDRWRDSAGVAARYITPVGAASLEFGQKLNRNDERKEKYFNFHFSIGTF